MSVLASEHRTSYRGPPLGTVETFPTRFGPFVLLRRLGAGGMGSAYLARHGDVDALLVVKRLHPELVRDDTIFKRFVHEAEVAAHVRHPNVAAVVAMGTVDGEPFLATEYVFGIPVSQVVDRVEQSLVDAVPLPVGLAMASELLAGLDAIHNACHRETGAPLGLIHRDIGARNVLVGFDGRVRIIDLGLGKSVLSDWQTAAQVLAGSPDYMAPEQAMGGRVDARADVYAAAVTIWELLAGRKRIRAESIAERVKRAVAAQPEALVSRRPDAPPRLEAILKQGMWPDPELRTPTAALLRRTLEEERRALGPRAKHEDVAAWLASSCATIIAKERRHLEDAHALERRALRPVRAETRFFVQEALERDPYAAYAADPEPEGRGGQDTGVRAALGKLAESDAAAALADLVDPERVRRGGWRARLALGAGVLAFMAVVAGVTAWILTPRPPDFQVERLPVPVVPPPPVVVPAPPPEPPPEPPEPVEPPPTAEEDPAPDEPRVATSPGIPQDLLRRRRALVERLRQLRRARFEIAFQRKLTHLSARLSSARSQRALDEIEAELKRLEAGG
jgi:serine/threonine protein kinase